MPRARVQPSGINPFADALGNVFEEFREAPVRQQRFRTGELENLLRGIEAAQAGFDESEAGGPPPPVQEEASVTFDPPTLRPRGRTEIGGEGLELVGPMLGSREGTAAERVAGVPRGSGLAGDVFQTVLDAELGGRTNLPFGMGSISNVAPANASEARVARGEVLEQRGLDVQDFERKVTAVMEAAAANDNPISRGEAIAAVENIDVPEDPQQPFEREGFESEDAFIEHRRRLAEATRAPPKPTGVGASARERRANNHAVKLLEGDPNMTLGEAGEATLEATGTAPNLGTVQTIMRGGGGGEVPLNANEAVVKAWWDAKMPEPEITRRIDAHTAFTPDEKFALKRYLAELSGRNAPLRPRAEGRNRALEAVLEVTGGAPPSRGPGQPPASSSGAGVPTSSAEAEALSPPESPDEFTSAIELLLQRFGPVPSRADIAPAAGRVPRTFRR